MRDKFRSWIRRRRQRILKILSIILILIILILYLENRNSSIVNKVEDSEVKNFILLRLRETPSAISVLPNSDTLVHSPTNHACNPDNGSSVFTLFMVVSSPANIAARNVLRSGLKLFLREYNGEIGGKEELTPNKKVSSLLFFIGQPESQLEKRKLLNEAQLHEDMIIDDFQESYLNLTLKSLRLLKWVEGDCYNAEFTVKLDDDVHVNLRRLFRILEGFSGDGSGKNLIGGLEIQNSRPVRDESSIYGKSFTPFDLWPNETFPDFIAGFFYVLGQEARTKIYAAALLKPLFHLEDVFITGIVANISLGMKLTNLPIISNFWTPLKNLVTSNCDLEGQYLGIHFYSTVFNYLDCWKQFNNKDFVCSNWPLFTHCWFD